MILDRLKTAADLFRRGGFTGLWLGLKNYVAYIAPLELVKYEDKRTDNQERWDYIRPHLDSDGFILDVGCAEGYFTRNAAAIGALAIGVDTNQGRLKRAVQRSDFSEGCGYLHLNLSPDNIEQLPEVNACLLLTVHHWWEKEFGLTDAEFMFRVLMDRSEVVIYEPPGDRPLIHELTGALAPEDSVNYYLGRLEALYGDDIDIIDFDIFEYGEYQPNMKNRVDPLFIIDTSAYTLCPDSRYKREAPTQATGKMHE